jgi:hypothetical protein
LGCAITVLPLSSMVLCLLYSAIDQLLNIVQHY